MAYLWLIRRQQLLGKLKPASGDIVLAHEGFKAEVSSVNADGRVLLKGGNGFGIWPDLIKSIVVRKGDTSQKAVRARIEAANTAASPCLGSVDVTPWRTRLDFPDCHYITVSSPSGGVGGFKSVNFNAFRTRARPGSLH